jgi:hypothetical protein
MARSTKYFLVIGAFLILGVVSAVLSRQSVNARITREAAQMLREGPGPALVHVLHRNEVSSVAIDADEIEMAQSYGIFGGILGRSMAALPNSLPQRPEPQAWIFARSKAIAPFTVLADCDSAWSSPSRAYTFRLQSLNLALFGFSVEISSWSTGAGYHGMSGAPSN